MKKKTLKKLLLRRRDEALAKIRHNNAKVAAIKEELKSLEELKEEHGRYLNDAKNEGVEMNAVKDIIDNEAHEFLSHGIFIVTSHQKNDVILNHFFDYIRSKPNEKVKTLYINNALSQKYSRTSDDQPMDWSIGALLYIGVIDREKGAMKFVNVDPNDSLGVLQLEYAKAKLGLIKGVRKLTPEMLSVDGQFRSLMINTLQGRKPN